MTVAARNTKYPKVIDILAKNGAEMNYETPIGGTPLIEAINFNSNPNIFKAIIKNGGKPYPTIDYYGEKINHPKNINRSYVDANCRWCFKYFGCRI